MVSSPSSFFSWSSPHSWQCSSLVNCFSRPCSVTSWFTLFRYFYTSFTFLLFSFLIGFFWSKYVLVWHVLRSIKAPLWSDVYPFPNGSYPYTVVNRLSLPEPHMWSNVSFPPLKVGGVGGPSGGVVIFTKDILFSVLVIVDVGMWMRTCYNYGHGAMNAQVRKIISRNTRRGCDPTRRWILDEPRLIWRKQLHGNHIFPHNKIREPNVPLLIFPQ